jgi:surface polysaccharide O-acyltransferase-like enzyme
MIWVDKARIFAVFAVIVLHVSAIVVVGIKDFYDLQWWFGNIYDSMVRWCVPVFVMISGALLLSEAKTESISIFYKKRILRLLTPTLFWSLFFTIWTYIQGFIQKNPPSILFLVQNLLLGKPYYHIWFLYMIAGLYLVTPFLRIFVRQAMTNEIISLSIALFWIAAINALYRGLVANDNILFTNWFLMYLPYFIVGHLITKIKLNISTKFIVFFFIGCVISTALGCFFVSIFVDLSKGLYFYDYLSITVIPMSLSVMLLFQKMNNPIINSHLTKEIANLSLGIYLIHPIVIESLNYCGISVLKFNSLISIPAVSCLVFIISAMITWFISKNTYLSKTI